MLTFFLLVPALIFQPAPLEPDPATVRIAIEKGLRQIERGARSYPKHRQCFSCHHQAVPMMALHAAKLRGFKVDEQLLVDQVDFTIKSFASKKGLEKGQGVGGASTTVGYAVLALAAAQFPLTPVPSPPGGEETGVRGKATLAAMIEFLLLRQTKDGSWTAQTKRPPTEGSPFTSTALALFSLKHYPPDSQNADLQKRVTASTQKGLDWLLANRGKETEDLVFRLRGLVSAEADRKEIDTARTDLLDKQLADGAWPQLPDMKGDAYATATALTALRLAGLPASDAAYVKGIDYLLKTQTDDGSWIVATRSRPIQVFFDNGDAGGASQFISFPTTAWAVLALLETVRSGGL